MKTGTTALRLELARTVQILLKQWEFNQALSRSRVCSAALRAWRSSTSSAYFEVISLFCRLRCENSLSSFKIRRVSLLLPVQSHRRGNFSLARLRFTCIKEQLRSTALQKSEQVPGIMKDFAQLITKATFRCPARERWLGAASPRSGSRIQDLWRIAFNETQNGTFWDENKIRAKWDGCPSATFASENGTVVPNRQPVRSGWIHANTRKNTLGTRLATTRRHTVGGAHASTPFASSCPLIFIVL